jgi:hemolysin activation/secretion protein
MKNTINSAITVSLAAVALLLPASSAHAEIHSKSKELVVMEARDLPEQAQARGNSLFLHSDNAGHTYLYVEQEQGKRLSVFDVTDPGRIKLAVSTMLPSEGAFDFVRTLGENAELVYFRDGQKVGVLDLHKTKQPVLRTLSIATNLDAAEPLGRSGLLATNESYEYIPAVSRDFQVIDISSANPTPLVTLKDVRHRLTNDETGTSFFLDNEGLSVVRRTNVENDYKVHQMFMQGN